MTSCASSPDHFIFDDCLKKWYRNVKSSKSGCEKSTRRMKTSSLRFCCVLIFCFLAQLVDCEANVDEGKACSEQHGASEN